MSSAQRRRAQEGRSQNTRKVAVPALAAPPVAGRSVLLVPLAFTGLLLLISLVPRVAENPVLVWSFRGAAAALLAWNAVLFARLRAAGAGRVLLFPPPRRQHWIQALVHTSIYLYWGFYWRPVYDYFWLLVAQLAFAYAFDMLLSWSRRDSYPLGFGAFPIIFSTNLFLWFRDDWFYLQFLMVAVGFLGKEFVKWEREGKRVHVFNPSAFSLGLFSIALIATGTTELTRGVEIASTLTLAPRMYTYLFLAGLVVMYFFQITLVAATAAATLFGLSALYYAVTGVPYFIDSEIPAAVFLGLHLLVTDPSTSPRTPPGRLVFGALYGLSVFALYTLLGAMGAPTFYDKLLAVPLLNLSVQRIDALVRPFQGRAFVQRLGLQGTAPTPRANYAHMGAWILFFGAMSLLGRTDARHTGDSLPFWAQACAEGRTDGCRRLLQIEESYCRDNSGWACNEVGRHYVEGRIVPADAQTAAARFAQACETRFQAGCVNLLDPGALAGADPRPLDLRLLLREGGRNLLETPEPELYARACEHGWTFACARVARSS